MIERPEKPVVYTDDTLVRVHGTVNSAGSLDTLPVVIVQSTAGESDTIVNSGGQVGFIGGAKCI
jgi:hypothetical protein